MTDPISRRLMRPASFRGVRFHVEVGARSGGRRLAPHEYPKRDDPYPEDMGRKGRTFPITGYCIGPTYQTERDLLIAALEQEGSATLIHPTLGDFVVKCGPYTCVERKDVGLYAEFEMTFLEDGTRAAFTPTADTQALVKMGADAAQSALVTSGNAVMDSISL